MLIDQNRDSHKNQSPSCYGFIMVAANDENDVSNKQDEKGRYCDNIGGNAGWDKAKKILPKG